MSNTHTSCFADIVLPIPLDTVFTYAVPESLQHRIAVGMRALVPVRNRVDTGFVVALHETCSLEKTKAILDLPDPGPVLSTAMLELCQWIAEYYCCSWGEALQCATPAGMRIGSQFKYRLSPEGLAPGRYTDRQKRIIGELHKAGPRTEGQLATVVGRTALSNTLQALVRRGVLLAEPVLKEAQVTLRTETFVRLGDGQLLDNAGLEALMRKAPKQAAVYVDLLHNNAEQRAGDLYEKHNINSTTLRALEKRGLILREEQERYRSPGLHFQQDGGKHTLNEEQAAALEAIIQSLDTGAYQTILLKGITGSGKTEVYLQAIEHALNAGKNAIILVPEISLTPQTVGRFFARFNQKIAVLHSGLSAGERYDEWRRALRGEVRIVVGARSAIFAPLPNVGIVIVDEEHDTSYKQGESPRYHARDVAIVRATRHNAVCVLGSATPSVETYYNSDAGKSLRIELNQRATVGKLPEVVVLDMKEEAVENAGELILSQKLEDAVKLRVDQKEQVILLLNRRGYSPYVLCPQCGWVAECPNCQVSLTYHRHDNRLKCHYCDVREQAPAVCDVCHFNPLIFLGSGTQKAEDYLERAFPFARVGRMDADTTRGKGGHARILNKFAQGEIDILIGTQMLAKGHDFPGVTLVGVINADAGLGLPDFRAAEQTFQLLTQVAGRAGRGAIPGEVIIQTYRPRHFAVATAATQNYGAFYDAEIEHRRTAGYPPFRRMANFLIESTDPEAAERHAVMAKRILKGLIEQHGFDGVQILGPAPATLKRINKKYRWNLAMLSKSGKRLNTLAREARDRFLEERKQTTVVLKVDLDPYGAH